MTSEEEPFVEDLEYQSTQKEIEELRKKEEELMVKINALEKKQKSASVSSLEEKQIEKEETASDNDEEENEELGKRRRPSLSRGSSKSSESMNSRPVSLEFENQAGTFRSRSSRSSNTTSPTKENRNSSSSSRGNVSSPTKESVYSSRSTISIKQSSARVTSEATSPIGKGYRIEVSSSSAFSPTKEDSSNVTSKTKMIRSYSATSPDKSPRNSETNLSKNSKNAKVLHRRSFPATEDNAGDIEMQNEKKSYSTTSLSKTKVPENKLSDRERKGSRDSCKDERSRSSIRINEDSYEIIEIGDDNLEQSPTEEKTCLSAREKIEMELVEQREREEELRMTKRLSGLSGKEDEIDKANESTDDEYDDDFDEGNNAAQDENNTLSTWEKIALEIEEEKRREDEIKKKKEEDIDGDSAMDESESASEEERSTDVFKRITQEIEEQKRREKEIRKLPSQEDDVSSEAESNGEVKSIGLSVQDRIELEIKEIEKRESELKKMHNSEEQEDVLEEEEEPKSPLRDTGTKSKIQQEIDDFKKKESEFRKLHGVDDESLSDDEGGENSRFSSMSVIERELVEQRRKEREFRREHKHELQRGNEDVDGNDSSSEVDDDDDDEIPEDESMLIERTKRKTKGNASSGSRMETNEKSELLVASGITKKFIHLFDKGVEKPVTKKRESPIIKSNKSDERPKINGQNYNDIDSNEEDLENVGAASFEEDDDVKEDEENELDTEKDDTEMQNKEEAIEKQHGIDAPSPGKKLVLKRKKSKDRKQEQQYKERNEEKSSTSYGSKVKMFVRHSKNTHVGKYDCYMKLLCFLAGS